MERTETPRTLVDYEEAARRLSVGRTTVWRMVKRGDLRQKKIGSRALITAESTDAFIARED